jgi:hypothetical protein
MCILKSTVHELDFKQCKTISLNVVQTVFTCECDIMAVLVTCLAGMVRWSMNYVLEGSSKETMGRWVEISGATKEKKRNQVIHYRSPDMQQ